MPWIKKNLMLVLGGLLGLILLGGSGFFLYSQYSRESAVNTSLEEKRTELDRLKKVTPYPEDKNIAAVKEDASRLDRIAALLKENIKPVDVPHVTDTYNLKVLIETTIADLKKEADEAGVKLPERYAFTFQRLREMPQFESNGIPKIAEQVAQISTLCRVLYQARVHTLDTLRRSPVLKDEGNSSEYLTKKPVTDQWVTRAPYDFSFRAFSGEMSEVLKGFASIPQCVVIKTVNVEPTSLPQSAPATTPGLMQPIPNPAISSSGLYPGLPGGMNPAMAARYGLTPGGGRAGEGGGPSPITDPALRARYGLGGPGGSGMSRYGIGGPATPAPQALSSTPPTGTAPAAPAGPSVVLDERPLRIIFQIDFVKPKPPGEAPTKKPAAPRPAPGADGAAPAAAPADPAAAPEQN